uniref:Putative secreted protein n=1 Tax=Anopheles darlingi TaxID=43151 RepID=A0A2M4DEA9_ANODA
MTVCVSLAVALSLLSSSSSPTTNNQCPSPELRVYTLELLSVKQRLTLNRALLLIRGLSIERSITPGTDPRSVMVFSPIEYLHTWHTWSICLGRY